MNEKHELDLLIDLAKLIKKHGPEAFEALATTIFSPEKSQLISNLLTQSANIGRASEESRKGKSTRKARSIKDLIYSIRESEPQKYNILLKFHDDYLSKAILPTLRDVKEFAQECGFTEIRGNSRKNFLGPLIKELIKMPEDELKSILNILIKYEKADRSLEGWSDLILGKERKAEY